MRYWPVVSVMTERTFSMSAGLVASTVTPGRTAPDVSRTTPVMVACADAVAGKSRRRERTAAEPRASVRIVFSSSDKKGSHGDDDRRRVNVAEEYTRHRQPGPYTFMTNAGGVRARIRGGVLQATPGVPA